MRHTSSAKSANSPRRRRPTAFSFIEILFAIMILAIGFIMIAAMFPVAIKQTDETVAEEVTALVAKQGSSVVARIAISNRQPVPYGNTLPTGALQYTGLDDSNLPLTPNNPPSASNASQNSILGWPPLLSPYFCKYGCVLGEDWIWSSTPLLNNGSVQYYKSIFPGTNFFSLSRGNLILTTDPRFAWVPFYCRNDPQSQYAQLILIGCQARNAPTFNSYDVLSPTNKGPSGGVMPANLQGRHALAAFFATTVGNYDYVEIWPDDPLFTFNNGSPGSYFPAPYTDSSALNALAEGAYLIVADDAPEYCRNVTSPAGLAVPFRNMSCNGFVYRLGRLLNGSGTPPLLMKGTNQMVGQVVSPPHGAPQFWSLMPGNDTKGAAVFPGMLPYALVNGNLTSATTSGSGTNICRVYFVGRGYTNSIPTSAGATYAPMDSSFTGPAMDVTAFSTFVLVKP